MDPHGVVARGADQGPAALVADRRVIATLDHLHGRVDDEPHGPGDVAGRHQTVGKIPEVAHQLAVVHRPFLPVPMEVTRWIASIVGTDDDTTPTAQQVVDDVERPPRLATLVTCRWWPASGSPPGSGSPGRSRRAPGLPWVVLALSAAAVLLAGRGRRGPSG
jgi:hypothetical protein